MRRLAALVLACAAVAAAATLARLAPRSASIDTGQTRVFKYAMGTSVRIEAYGGDAAARQQAADEAFAAIANVDRVMSDYRDDSEVSLVNRMAARAPVAVSPALYAAFAAGQRVSDASGGAFDTTAGPLADLWGLRTGVPHTPTPAELHAVRPLVDWRQVVLDTPARTISFGRPGMRIDLSGIAIGFAAQRGAAALRRNGLSGVVDAGGTQFLVGRPIGKRHWSIGIVNPDRPDDLVGAVDVDEGAVSTVSASFAVRPPSPAPWHLVLDPRTLQPVHASLSATVVSPDAMLSSALARAVFVLGPADGLTLLQRFPGTWGIVASGPDDGGIDVSVSAGRQAVFHPPSQPGPVAPSDRR